MKRAMIVSVGVMMIGLLAGCQSGATKTYGDEKFRPRLLAMLPLTCNTPDGMRLDPKTSEVYLCCPNFNQKEYPAVLMKIMPDNSVVKVCDLPKHPETGYAGPMGLDIAPDGNIYYADNQYFYNKDHRSRLIRIRMKDGKAVGFDVVVDGFKLSNAVVIRNGFVYVTDTFFDLADKPGASGTYRFALKDLEKGTIKLKPKGQADPHLIATYQTTPLERRKNEVAGADGMTFDGQGNLYVGNFGDGVIFKTTFNADGSVKETKQFVKAWDVMTCVDGMVYDARRNCIYVADSERNAVQRVSLPDGKVTTLWRNDDTDGSDGLLDQPCEPCLRGNELILANFDMPFPGLLNAKYDAVPTLSIMKLE